MALENKVINCVCTANICRSPMAERLLAHALESCDSPLSEIQVISSGVYASPNMTASPNSVEALRKVGIDLSDHSSQMLTPEIIENSLLTLCMTESHSIFIEETYPEMKSPVLLMRQLLPEPANKQIPDPYGMNLQAYEECRDSMVEAIPSIIEFVKEQAKKAK